MRAKAGTLTWTRITDQNLAHVVAAVDFVAEETVEQPSDASVLTGDDVEVGPAQVGSLSETIERANEVTDN